MYRPGGAATLTPWLSLCIPRRSPIRQFFTVSVEYYISFGGFTKKNVSMGMGITIPGTIYEQLSKDLDDVVNLWKYTRAGVLRKIFRS